MHARGVLLPDVAALGEADPVLFARIRLQPQRRVAAQFGRALDDPQRQPMRMPALGLLARRRYPATPQRRVAWIGHPCLAVRRPVHAKRRVDGDVDRPSQPVHLQPPHQRLGVGSLAIDQQIVAIVPDNEVEQRLALAASAARHRWVARPDTSLVTSPWCKPRTSAPDRRMTARSIRVVAVIART